MENNHHPQGFPDLASRAFLHHLHTTHPSLPVYALVDWNPAGVSIALTYKYGSRNMGLEVRCCYCWCFSCDGVVVSGGGWVGKKGDHG